MADRTFTADDVIRIFEENLDEDEMETVRLFFAPEVNIDAEILKRLLELLLALVSALTTPLIGLLLSVLPQVTTDAYNDAVGELFRVNRSLDSTIRSLDA